MKSCFALLICVFCSSCVWQIDDWFGDAPYPGTLPPAVIADACGQAAQPAWLQLDPEALPAPQSFVESSRPKMGRNSTPYGFKSGYTHVIISPYPPFLQLSYQGFASGDRVWDPYTRKPFLIP